MQISFAITAKLISAFGFTAWKVQVLLFLNRKFEAAKCNVLLRLYRPPSVGPGLKLRRCSDFRDLILACILFYSNMAYIRITCQCDEYPLKPHFYIVKLGYAWVYLFLAHLSRRLTGELIVCPCSGVRRPSSFTISKIFSSETAWPIKAKLRVEHP